MNRRDLLRMAPLWALKVEGAQTGLMAEVKPHRGVPTLHLNGKPVFAAINWVGTPSPQKWESAAAARHAAEAGVHIYTFEAGTAAEWKGPAPGRSSPFDFSTVEARFGRIIDVDPQAMFHLRCHLEIGADDWWSKAYPQECEVHSNGRRYTQSFASKLWRSQAKDFLREYAAYLSRSGLMDRVVSFQAGAGHTGEWVKGETSMYTVCGDYSEPMRVHFRAWLRGTYRGDAAALQAAWKDPKVTFDNAEVPSAKEQLESRGYTFRDPREERKTIDYFRCLAELCGDLVVDFCATAKEATQRKKLAGAFYGYLMELAWNGGFFQERPDSDYSTYQRSGHIGLRRVLESPDVDFLVSPYSYGFRGMGGDGPTMTPAESVKAHGKLVLIEDDTRTHIGTDPNYGRANTLGESVAILRRNFAQVVIRGQGLWWALWNVDASKEPAFGPELKMFQSLGNRLLSADRTSTADVAVLLDDESLLYESCRNNLDIPLIFQQRLWGLPRMGTGFDTYLLNDFLGGNLRPYKLYFFLNCFHLDPSRREALKRQLRRDGRVALWAYAPGYIDDKPALETMRDLTGMEFGTGEQPWGPLVHTTDFTHPITAALPQDLVWGTNSKLSPIFYVNDRQARVLGQVVYSQGNCKPGFAVKQFPEWTSVYVSAPNLPAAVLRGIARFAGAHVYSDAGDVLYACRDLLAVHTVGGGKRVFHLPRTAEVVYDLFAGRRLAQNVDKLEVTLPPASTALYHLAAAASYL